MIRQFFLITLVTFSLFVFGCSGGGDNKENTPPSADAGPDQTVEEKSLVTLSGSGTDSDGTIESYLWSQSSGSATNLNSKDTAHATFTALEVTEETILTFRLTVTDNGGASDSNDVTVKVNPVNLPPSADAGLDRFVPGETAVTLSGSGTDSDGTIVSYTWTQVEGIGVTINNADPATATFTAPDATDLLTFRFTVTDDEGAIGSDDVTISVGEVFVSDDFEDGNDNGWIKVNDTGNGFSWQVINGEYLQQHYVESVDGGTPFVESYHLGTYSFLNAGLDWTCYRFSVEVTPLPDDGDDIPQGNDVGVMFRYLDEGNYYRFAFNSRYGFSRLEKRVGGVLSTLAVDSAGYYEGNTLNVTIEVNGSLIQVYVDDDPVFSISDSSLSEGTIALYCQDKAKFDNILVTENSLAPSVVISSPVAYSISITDTIDVSAIATNVPQGGSIEFVLDNDDMTSVVDSSFPYTAQFSGVSQGEHNGEHTVGAILRDVSGHELGRDTNVQVGVMGDYYVAVGDSITNGSGDDDSSDNTSQDGRIVGIQGYEANLNDLLTSTLNYPHIVFNEGIGGDTSAQALGRIDSILERHPGSNKVLILLGTNDAGSGVSSEVFRSNMQSLINMVPEGMDVWVALVPPAFDENGVPDSVRNSFVVNYNDVIKELTGIQVGPDLYNFFHTRPSLFTDEVHPNALGYEAMAYLWHNELNRDNQLALPPYLENP